MEASRTGRLAGTGFYRTGLASSAHQGKLRACEWAHHKIGLDFQKGIRRFQRSLRSSLGLLRTSRVWQDKPGEYIDHGREAVSVRQIFLVIILVAAAFAGGAFVNGPALQWAQSRIFRSLGWHESDIASIDLKV